jgi:uncharacterized LabA/DUF88 family protein
VFVPEQKAVLFIDGFNLYHSLDNKEMRKYKWLDLRTLGEQFITTTETLTEVNYFTAFSWNQKRKERHKIFIAVNETRGCNVILGRFQEKTRKSLCRCSKICEPPFVPKPHTTCGKSFTTHEEKLTDVNIAVHILKACILGNCDSIYLLSGDNDLIPALETSKELCPQIKIRVLFPVNARAKNLMDVCNRHGFQYMTISELHLQRAQFPDSVIVEDKVYTKPSTWA